MPSTPLASARPLIDCQQLGFLRVGGDDQLAAIAMRHAVFRAVGVEQAPAGTQVSAIRLPLG
jgi:hypothetical protein